MHERARGRRGNQQHADGDGERVSPAIGNEDIHPARCEVELQIHFVGLASLMPRMLPSNALDHGF